MTQQPLFSVLIANYNNGKYLQEAINSVVEQTYTNWEVVIVDDGSTDESRGIYASLSKDTRIHIHLNESNRGCGYSKRRCVELATGELCGFLDADDVLLPNALEDHVEVHLQREDVSCCFSRFYYCDIALDVIKESRLLYVPPTSTYLENKDYAPEHFTSFKKARYAETQGIDESLPAAVDQDLYFKLEEVAPVCVLDKFTYKYRSTPNQISQGGNWSTAFSFNMRVRLNACERRGLKPVAIYGNELYDVLPQILQELDNTKEELRHLRLSKAYRLGKFLLKPLGSLKK